MRSESKLMRVAAVAAAGFTLLAALAACEEKPYALPLRQAEAPAPRVTDLAGAPSITAEAAPVTASEAPMPESAAPAYAPPVPPPAYDAGEPQIVAMAPIPNPVEPAFAGMPLRHPRRTDTWTVASSAPAHRTTHRVSAGPTYAPRAHAAYALRTVRPHRTYAQATPSIHARPRHASNVGPAASQVASAPSAAPKAVVSRPAAHRAVLARRTQAAPRSGVVIVDKSADPARVAALQSALTDAVSKNAVLTLPSKFDPGQPADVSLTLPADFADTVRKQAQAQGLSAAAQTVNLSAALAGQGFTVTPSDSQAQPLTAGQPTEFHWSATVKPGTRGPLRADVGADLLGGGDTPLQLGAVQQKSGALPDMSNKTIGIGLLILIGVVVLAFLARGRRPPPHRPIVAGDRPLDMTRPGRNLDLG